MPNGELSAGFDISKRWSACPVPWLSRSTTILFGEGSPAPAALNSHLATNPVKPPEKLRGGELVSATRMSPLGSTVSVRG